MKPEFHFTRKDFTAEFEAICGTVAEAERLLSEFPSICGVVPVRDKDTLTFTLHLDHLDEALLLLERAGYATFDLVARDTDYALQDWSSDVP